MREGEREEGNREDAKTRLISKIRWGEFCICGGCMDLHKRNIGAV